MEPALWTAKTGLEVQTFRMANISNNLANASTTGFKKDLAQIENLPYQVIRQPGGQDQADTQIPSGLMVGTGAKITSTKKDFTTGPQTQTGAQLDVAINGRGFLQVTLPTGDIGYTRAGNLQLTSQGQIVDANGYPLLPGFTVPQGTTNITIGSDGTVSASITGQADPSNLGQLQLAGFINPEGLLPIGKNLFKQTAASGDPQTGIPGDATTGMGNIVQGSLESSNVNVVEELVNMIETQRSYEINGKAIGTVDKMLDYLNQQVA